MKKETDILRKKRRELDLSQEYIAMELGISQKAYSDIESGKTTLKNDTLCKIANILGVKPSEICPISDRCENNQDQDVKGKHLDLVAYLKSRNIDFPEELE